MSSWKMPAVLSTWISRLTNLLDRRLHDVFALVFRGLLFTRERRRTCTTWFRAGGITEEFQPRRRAVGSTAATASRWGCRFCYDIGKVAGVSSLPSPSGSN